MCITLARSIEATSASARARAEGGHGKGAAAAAADADAAAARRRRRRKGAVRSVIVFEARKGGGAARLRELKEKQALCSNPIRQYLAWLTLRSSTA